MLPEYVPRNQWIILIPQYYFFYSSTKLNNCNDMILCFIVNKLTLDKYCQITQYFQTMVNQNKLLQMYSSKWGTIHTNPHFNTTRPPAHNLLQWLYDKIKALLFFIIPFIVTTFINIITMLWSVQNHFALQNLPLLLFYM